MRNFKNLACVATWLRNIRHSVQGENVVCEPFWFRVWFSPLKGIIVWRDSQASLLTNLNVVEPLALSCLPAVLNSGFGKWTSKSARIACSIQNYTNHAFSSGLTEAPPAIFWSRYLSHVWVKSCLSESNLSKKGEKKMRAFATYPVSRQKRVVVP